MANWSGRVSVLFFLVCCVLFLVAASENLDVEKDAVESDNDGNVVEGKEEGEPGEGDAVRLYKV